MAMKYDQRHIDNEDGMVGEATAVYGTTDLHKSVSKNDVSVMSDAEDLPSDILRIALECAREDKKNGRLIPGAKIGEIISKEMGWI